MKELRGCPSPPTVPSSRRVKAASGWVLQGSVASCEPAGVGGLGKQVGLGAWLQWHLYLDSEDHQQGMKRGSQWLQIARMFQGLQNVAPNSLQLWPLWYCFLFFFGSLRDGTQGPKHATQCSAAEGHLQPHLLIFCAKPGLPPVLDSPPQHLPTSLTPASTSLLRLSGT